MRVASWVHAGTLGSACWVPVSVLLSLDSCMRSGKHFIFLPQKATVTGKWVNVGEVLSPGPGNQLHECKLVFFMSYLILCVLQ